MLSRYCVMDASLMMLSPASCRLLTLYTNGFRQDRQGGPAILQDRLERIVIMTRSWRSIVCPVAGFSALVATGLALGVGLHAETGSDLWLRYAPLTGPLQRASYPPSPPPVVVQARAPPVH